MKNLEDFLKEIRRNVKSKNCVKSAIMLKTKGISFHGIYISRISRVMIDIVKITPREYSLIISDLRNSQNLIREDLDFLNKEKQLSKKLAIFLSIDGH